VLVSAHREENSLHEPARSWLRGTIDDDAPYGMSDLVLSGFLRIVTNARTWNHPSTVQEALAFVRAVRDQPHCVVIRPRARHGELFLDLVATTGATGSRVPDAYFAALAIDASCEWITFDRGFARYPGLRWRSPLDSA